METVAFFSTAAGELVAPDLIGFRWAVLGNWNLEQRAAGQETEPSTSLLDLKDEVAAVGFPTLAAMKPAFRSVPQQPVLIHRSPAKRLTLASGESRLVVSVYDLVLANYGLDRGSTMRTPPVISAK